MWRKTISLAEVSFSKFIMKGMEGTIEELLAGSVLCETRWWRDLAKRKLTSMLHTDAVNGSTFLMG